MSSVPICDRCRRPVGASSPASDLIAGLCTSCALTFEGTTHALHAAGWRPAYVCQAARDLAWAQRQWRPEWRHLTWEGLGIPLTAYPAGRAMPVYVFRDDEPGAMWWLEVWEERVTFPKGAMVGRCWRPDTDPQSPYVRPTRLYELGDTRAWPTRGQRNAALRLLAVGDVGQRDGRPPGTGRLTDQDIVDKYRALTRQDGGHPPKQETLAEALDISTRYLSERTSRHGGYRAWPR